MWKFIGEANSVDPKGSFQVLRSDGELLVRTLMVSIILRISVSQSKSLCVMDSDKASSRQACPRRYAFMAAFSSFCA